MADATPPGQPHIPAQRMVGQSAADAVVCLRSFGSWSANATRTTTYESNQHPQERQYEAPAGEHAARAAATVQAFLPGEEGAGAIAGVLSGRVNPSGRLPVQIPGLGSSQPGTYLAPPLALKSEGISNIDPTPAYPFGHGLSYTTFTIGEAEAEAETSRVLTDGTVRLRATITNTGTRPGTAVPQLYLSDPVASVTRPVRRLIGFTRVDLEPGRSACVEFEVHADLAAFTGRDLRRRVEPGRITLTVAQSAADPGAAADIELTGQLRTVGHDRVQSSRSHILAALESGDC